MTRDETTAAIMKDVMDDMWGGPFPSEVYAGLLSNVALILDQLAADGKDDTPPLTQNALKVLEDLFAKVSKYALSYGQELLHGSSLGNAHTGGRLAVDHSVANVRELLKDSKSNEETLISALALVRVCPASLAVELLEDSRTGDLTLATLARGVFRTNVAIPLVFTQGFEPLTAHEVLATLGLRGQVALSLAESWSGSTSELACALGDSLSF
jgi:hypothetical protein